MMSGDGLNFGAQLAAQRARCQADRAEARDRHRIVAVDADFFQAFISPSRVRPSSCSRSCWRSACPRKGSVPAT